MFSNLFFIISTIFTRFIGLKWGNGYFFHPDENNMISAIRNFSANNFNPHFFAYGQFPLYLSYFTFRHYPYGLRIWSAIFSCLSILFFYYISKIIFKKNYWIFVLLLIFNPGLIQLAHFGTTESILIFVFTVNMYLALLLSKKIKLKYLFWAALVTGIGIATKVTAVIFILPIIFALRFNFIHIIYYLLITTIFSCVFSPYSIIANSEFFGTMSYETNVATGKTLVFYTRQFLNTLPYYFQFTKIFPYVSGITVFILGLLGIFKLNKKYFLILLPAIIYFLYTGQLFVKWTRFVSPVFFVFPFLATIFLITIKSKLLRNVLIYLSIIPALIFMQIYFHDDIRIVASKHINTLPTSTIFSEAGNVLNIPLGRNSHDVTNFDFYELDAQKNDKELYSDISKSNYIIIPSRRVFKNQNNSKFPLTQLYYSKLFFGDLGFNLYKEFEIKSSLLLNAENAEETWTVFDHPKIRIYEKK